MSKSLKNYVTIKVTSYTDIYKCKIMSYIINTLQCILNLTLFIIQDFLKSYTANEFRLFCLLTRYRSGMCYKGTPESNPPAVLQQKRGRYFTLTVGLLNLPAIDYSDASMNEARSTLSTISAFCHNAQAYMQGHLQCQPIEEGILWER